MTKTITSRNRIYVHNVYLNITRKTFSKNSPQIGTTTLLTTNIGLFCGYRGLQAATVEMMPIENVIPFQIFIVDIVTKMEMMKHGLRLK